MTWGNALGAVPRFLADVLPPNSKGFSSAILPAVLLVTAVLGTVAVVLLVRRLRGGPRGPQDQP